MINSHIKTWLTTVLGGEIELEKHAFSNQDDVYIVASNNTNYYLKVAASLEAEHDNIEKVRPYILVPYVVGFKRIDAVDCLLMSEVAGKNLAEQTRDDSPTK